MGKTAGKGMSQLFEPVGLHGSPVPTVSVGICEAAPASGLADISFFQISLSFVKDKSLEGVFPPSSHPPFSNSFLGQTPDLPEVNGCFVPGFFGSCFFPNMCKSVFGQ